MEKVVIEEGVNLHIINTNKFKTTIICILIRRPLNRSEVTFNSIIPNILKRGCRSYNSLTKLNAKLENMYGTIFDAQIVKMGEEQLIQFYLDILNKDIDSNIIDESLKFLSEIILDTIVENGGFKKEILDIEKENLKNRIEGRINNKSSYAKLKCLEVACKGEPFSLYGDGYTEDLDNIDSVNLYEHYIKILKTSIIEFIVIGDEDKDIILQKIKKYFNFGKRESTKYIDKSKIICNKRQTVIEKENLDITQGKICIAIKSDIESKGMEFYSFLLMNEILGGSPNSKLFINVREKESLCYNISSFIYRFKGIMMIQSGVDKENFDKIIELIKKEIENIKEGKISEKEFENAKQGLIKNFKGMKDHQSAIINFYVSQYMLEDDDTLDDVIKKISEVKKESVISCASRIYLNTIYLLS